MAAASCCGLGLRGHEAAHHLGVLDRTDLAGAVHLDGLGGGGGLIGVADEGGRGLAKPSGYGQQLEARLPGSADDVVEENPVSVIVL